MTERSEGTARTRRETGAEEPATGTAPAPISAPRPSHLVAASGRDSRLRIAMLGTRGVPARWGGIERHVEEIGARLAAKGHEVTVYCRANYQPEAGLHRGMRLVPLRTVGTKHLDAIVHTASATARAVRRRYDVVHYHALGPGLFAPVARTMSTAKVVLTVHGLDHQRAKWGGVARAVLGTAAWTSTWAPHAVVAVSAELEARHVGRRAPVVRVTNGVTAPGPHLSRGEACARLGLGERPYVLFVGRLVPEKAPDQLLAAFARLAGDDLRLVLAGGSSFSDDYVATLRAAATADSRVVLAGYVHGAELDELYANAAVFVLPSRLEGLPLTLLEAASYATPVVASAIAPHVEVVGRPGPG
ncbi:MAG: glycosyltransferase family 4 protein, partial [Acidimicrobiia bacterium]|nr:glycosyltransferase family 4 protein [Acidimicrobiia bacterium]